MGIQNRDYYRQSSRPGAFGSMPMWTISIWLVAINVGIYVIDNFFLAGWGFIMKTPSGSIPLRFLEAWGHFSWFTAIENLQVWRFITFQFLHGSLGHLIGNMLGIYFFGPLVEDRLGRRRFLAFYLLCGVTGPLAYLVFQAIGVLPRDAYVPLIGASAGVFGILIAGAIIAPNITVQLLIPPIPVKLATLAYFLIGLAVFTVFTRGANAGGEAAHLGGIAMGYYLIKNPNLLNFAEVFGKKKPRMRIRY